MKATSSRRQLIVALLLVLAVLGAVMRQFAPQPSLVRDVGTLLLVLWLPVIGNVVAFVIARVRPRRAGGFDPDSAFTPHVLVELTARPHALPAVAANERCCTLVIGAEGFTARLAEPLAQWLAEGHARTMQVQFLRPALALPRFAPEADFKILLGRSLAGSGRVLRAANSQ